ncbi:GNAT family N-acetyltransferase [Treponema zioleckii]|uniref:GNAT family N-acetyltransferase n=1 Tax=Treponema zioleckii TaxID=331680 RepID=UPI00168BAE66|nr:GNAT family N-acetyltransferase [Treponema zioleckii]
MEIIYKETKDFTEIQIEELFRSVNWESAKYPEKLVRAMKNSSRVISAWDRDKLVGLARALDDGETVALIHYVLVNPKYQGLHIGYELVSRLISAYKDLLYIKVMPSEKKSIAFYEKFGFRQYDNYSAMVIKRV